MVHAEIIRKNADMNLLSAYTGKCDVLLGKEGLAELAETRMPKGTCTPLTWIITEAGKKLLTTYQVILK